MIDLVVQVVTLGIASGAFVLLLSSVSRVDTWALREAAVIGIALLGGSLAYLALTLVASPIAVPGAWLAAIVAYIIGRRRSRRREAGHERR